MSETKFTKGPWSTKPVDDLRGTEGFSGADLAIIGANHIVVGIVYEAGPKGSKRLSDDDFEANARLIAAAPALYETLKNLRQYVAARDVETVDAALALITGETK